jgi:uncharacterized protein YjbJ (UPF0337 family)
MKPSTMNRVRGLAKEFKGRAKELAGRATHSERLEMEGRAEARMGRAQYKMTDQQKDIGGDDY